MKSASHFVIASAAKQSSSATLNEVAFPWIASATPRNDGAFGVVALVAAVMTLATPALADDKAACADGIAAVKAELAKNPPEPALAKAKKALRIAEREEKEGEFDECLEALDDAKRALK